MSLPMGRRISGRARPDAATSPGRRGHRAQPPRERTSQAPPCRRPSTVRLIPLLTNDPAAGLLDPKPTPEALCAEPSAAKEETSGGAKRGRVFASLCYGRRGRLVLRLKLYFSEMAVRPHRVSQCIPSRGWAGEAFQFAVAIIIEPLDAPFAGCFAILENLRWLAAVKRLRLVLRPVLRFVAHTRRRCDGPHRFLKRQWLLVGHCRVSDAVQDAKLTPSPFLRAL